MASIQYSKLIGSGAGLDYVDQILGKCSYTLDLGPKARASTTKQITAVIDLSADYAGALACGAGHHYFDATKGYNRFTMGFAAAPNGADIKSSGVGAGDYPTAHAIPQRIIAASSCANAPGADNYYDIGTHSQGLMLNMSRDPYRLGSFLVDSVTSPLSGSPSLYLPDNRAPGILANNNPSVLRTNTIGLCLLASGSAIHLYIDVLYGYQDSQAAVTVDGMKARAREFIVGPTKYGWHGYVTLANGDPGSFLRAHPYLFIQWPNETVPLNIHNVYASFQT